MTKKSDLKKWEKEVEKTYGTRATPSIYVCKHWAKSAAAKNPGEDIRLTMERQNYKIMTDEQEAFIWSGKQIAEADGLHGTGSVVLCQDCEDAYHLAGAQKGDAAWHAWKKGYDKRFPAPVEAGSEPPVPVVVKEKE